ncbi:MAG: RsmE family RNA methyltransferase [Vampirovibrionales bacterium]
MALVKQVRRLAVEEPPPTEEAQPKQVGETLHWHTQESLHQLRTVLRVKVGMPLQAVCFTHRCVYEVMLSEVDHKQVTATIETVTHLPAPSATAPRLFACLLKEQAWDTLLQQATELGVADIIPVMSQHTTPLVGDVTKKLARWREIVLRASLQCERSTLPVIHDPIPLAEAVATVFTHLTPTPAEPSPIQAVALVERSAQLPALRECLLANATPAFFIGPEGGWTVEEVGLFQTAGVQCCHVGAAVLKAETAAMVALSVCYTQR